MHLRSTLDSKCCQRVFKQTWLYHFFLLNSKQHKEIPVVSHLQKHLVGSVIWVLAIQKCEVVLFLIIMRLGTNEVGNHIYGSHECLFWSLFSIESFIFSLIECRKVLILSDKSVHWLIIYTRNFSLFFSFFFLSRSVSIFFFHSIWILLKI